MRRLTNNLEHTTDDSGGSSCSELTSPVTAFDDMRTEKSLVKYRLYGKHQQRTLSVESEDVSVYFTTTTYSSVAFKTD